MINEVQKLLNNLSIPDLDNFFLMKNKDLFIRSPKNNALISSTLEQRFKQKCLKADIIDWSYHNPYKSLACDYEFVYHFMHLKIALGGKEKLSRNENLKDLVKNTYLKHKDEYLKRKKSSPHDNKWAHLLPCVKWLGLLEKREKNLWISWYSSTKIDKAKPILPQVWNRVWAFVSALDVKNIEDLKNYSNLDITLAKRNICGNNLTIKNLDKENIFKEKKIVMYSKHLHIKKFCNCSLGQDEVNKLRNYLAK